MSPARRRRTSARVTDIFDRRLRSLRRDRAARLGPELFLFDRAFDDCLDRLQAIPRRFERALLIGCPSDAWPARLHSIAKIVEPMDPGLLFAEACAGTCIEEDRTDFGEERYDLCVAVGTLDTVNDLPFALHLISRALRPDSPLIGAIAGGHSLPALRSSLIEAGRSEARVVARTHPRIEASALGSLLSTAGFGMQVVDVDRIRLRYESLDALVRDLRSMAATAVLANRPPPLARAELDRAREAFAAQAQGGRTEEVVEILHFVAWRQ